MKGIGTLCQQQTLFAFLTQPSPKKGDDEKNLNFISIILNTQKAYK